MIADIQKYLAGEPIDFSAIPVDLAGVDYVAQQGTLHFAPLQVTGTISIEITNDALVEDDNSFLVILSNPSDGANLHSPSTVTVVITSNDRGIQFASDTFYVNEDSGTAEVWVTRSGGPTRLTLITCWPFDALRAGGPERYVVIAQRI